MIGTATGAQITLAHGEGARLTRQLIQDEILATLRNPHLEPLADAATLPASDRDIVFTTDAHVVTPLFIPGADIGKIAVYGAVNDLAVCGADPAHLSLALVIEEGFPIANLRRVLRSVADACRQCGVIVVTGDTKVVPRGAADGLFLVVSGIGYRRPGIELGPHRITPGDRIIVSGTLGDHGIAVLAARDELFEATVLQSDAAPIHGLVTSMLDVEGVVFLRDPTRGGVAAVLHELSESQPWGVLIDEAAVPVSPAVRGACELLGLDPLHVPNEGKVVAVVRECSVNRVLAVMNAHPLGKLATVIGQITAEPGRVVVRGPLRQCRPLVDPAGAPLPRIC